MVHPDHETRVGAHRIFSVVLVPSSVCPRPCPSSSPNSSVSKKASDLPRTLSRTVSVFSSSAALFEKLRKEKFDNKGTIMSEGEAKDSNSGMLNRMMSYTRVYSLRGASSVPSTIDGHSLSIPGKELVRYGNSYISRTQN